MAMTLLAQSYMSRPCSIARDEDLWCVSGHHIEGGGGVLAWCYNKDDAIEVAMELWDTEMFTGLNYHKFI